jgi:hypothetical protein
MPVCCLVAQRVPAGEDLASRLGEDIRLHEFLPESSNAFGFLFGPSKSILFFAASFRPCSSRTLPATTAAGPPYLQHDRPTPQRQVLSYN